jgi:hypothetical protein
MTREKAMEPSPGQMADNISEIGNKASSMERALT